MAEEQGIQATEQLDKLYEFEREPVSEDNLQPKRHFAGLFAGEHVAGTEFVIGGLFISLGATVQDVLVGLLIGNLLAVLTWTFICAPIAVQTRLTLYWYLRKIAGPGTTLLYNILNACLFCILAGCMITVSASAVRVFLDMYTPLSVPAQNGWLPTADAGGALFAVVVILIGAVVVTLAIFGFKRLAQFSSICSPWMILMFLAGGIVSLPYITSHTAGVSTIGSLSDFWQVGRENIWRGVNADGNPNPGSFWQVAAFAWICNLAMHGSLSDMALFRYARTHWYGLFSAIGMFIGHYMAWIAAGMMGALTMLMLEQNSLTGIDPGELAYRTLGFAGIIAVIIAGWTTSNPTLYRAGLAFQAVTPNWPRWKVTLVAGIATTIIAISPKVFTGLLNFVGIYGLLLVPIGGVVFAEHWIFPRIGYTRYWASYRKVVLSWPALVTWAIAIVFALLFQLDVVGNNSYLVKILNGLGAGGVAEAIGALGFIHLFYMFIPVWLLSIVLYIVFAGMAGAKTDYPEAAVAEQREQDRIDRGKAHIAAKDEGQPTTKLQVARVISLLMLGFILVWPIIVYASGEQFGGPGFMSAWETFKTWLVLPTLIYFVSATIWAIERDKLKGQSS